MNSTSNGDRKPRPKVISHGMTVVDCSEWVDKSAADWPVSELQKRKVITHPMVVIDCSEGGKDETQKL